jgi:hypothetical protein
MRPRLVAAARRPSPIESHGDSVAPAVRDPLCGSTNGLRSLAAPTLAGSSSTVLPFASAHPPCSLPSLLSHLSLSLIPLEPSHARYTATGTTSTLPSLPFRLHGPALYDSQLLPALRGRASDRQLRGALGGRAAAAPRLSESQPDLRTPSWPLVLQQPPSTNLPYPHDFSSLTSEAIQLPLLRLIDRVKLPRCSAPSSPARPGRLLARPGACPPALLSLSPLPAVCTSLNSFGAAPQQSLTAAVLASRPSSQPEGFGNGTTVTARCHGFQVCAAEQRRDRPRAEHVQESHRRHAEQDEPTGCVESFHSADHQPQVRGVESGARGREPPSPVEQGPNSSSRPTLPVPCLAAM